MALSPKDQQTRDNLVAASQHLREEGKTAWAESVDLVLSPQGSAFINRLRFDRHEQAIESGDAFPNMPIRMDRQLRDHFKAAAKAEKDRMKAAARQEKDPAKAVQLAEEAEKYGLTTEADEGLRQFVAGDFRPDKPQRAEYGSAADKVNLNLRIDPQLRTQADEKGEELALDLGWTPLASHVIHAWLIQRFPPDVSGPKQ